MPHNTPMGRPFTNSGMVMAWCILGDRSISRSGWMAPTASRSISSTGGVSPRATSIIARRISAADRLRGSPSGVEGARRTKALNSGGAFPCTNRFMAAWDEDTRIRNVVPSMASNTEWSNTNWSLGNRRETALFTKANQTFSTNCRTSSGTGPT